METTANNMKLFYGGLQTAFNMGFGGVTADWQKISFTVPSKTSGENYAWMNDLPKMREWIGSRVLKQVSDATYYLKNKTWEDTIVVPREMIEDDQYGIYSPLSRELGRAAAEHPSELVFEALMKGFERECYDGQNFFDLEHPVKDPKTNEDKLVANMQDGAGEPWFILDTTRVIRPIIFQERRKAEFNSMTDPKQSDHVFMNKEFIYGADGRWNVGYSFWQLAYASKAPLTKENIRAARNAMKKLESDEGRKLGIRPTTLVVGIGNADVARDLIKAERLDGGKSNTDRDILEILENPYAD